MNYRLIEAKHVRDYIVWLRFSDGVCGDIDLVDELDGPVFAPLQRIDYFTTFQLHPELHTLVWDNGADFAPEFLHDRLTVTA